MFDGGGTYLGVLAMQMPIGRINRVMQVSAGLGETGEAYMVGADLLMRSDSQFTSGSTILEAKVDTEPARKALAGETGVEVVPEHRGMAMVSAFGPLEFMGVRWAVIAEIGQAELLAPVAETGRFMIVAVAGILLLVTAVGIALARGMSQPIVEMTQTMRRLAAGDLEVEIGATERTDEIGEMAAALDVFKENAVRRQKAEEALKESGALFEQAARMAHVGHWAYDKTSNKLTHCSEEIASFFGLTVEEYIAGFSIDVAEMALVHPDDRDEFGALIADAHANANSYDTVFRALPPDGKVRYIREVGQPIFDNAGKFVRMIGSAQDITEQKQIEASLTESEAVFGQAARMAHLGHWVFDEKLGRLTTCSEEVARIHGLTVEDYLAGFTINDPEMELVHPDEREEFIALIVDVHANAKSYDTVYRSLRPDGAVLHVREVGQPIFDDAGTFVRMIGSAQDITKQKQAEEALKESKALFEQAGRMAHLGHWAYDEIENRVTHCSEETARIHGLTVDEYMERFSQGDTELMLVHPDDRQDLDDLLEDAQQNATGYDTDYRIVLPDGGVRHIREVGDPVFDDTGTLVRTIGMVQDITERKTWEEDLARKEVQLRIAMDNMPGGMFMVDEQLKIQVFNNQYAEIYEFPDDAIRVGGSLSDAVKFRAERGDYGAGDPEELVEQRMQSYIERMTLRHEEELPNGRIIELLRTPVEGGGVVGIATDITERKEADEELARKEAQLRLALDNMADGLFVIDPDLHFSLFNDRYRDLMGVGEDVLNLGASVRDLCVHIAERGAWGEGNPEELADLRVAALANDQVIVSETVIDDGRILETRKTPREGGGCVGVVRDITAR